MKSIHQNYGVLNSYISLMMVIPLQHIAKYPFCCLSDLLSSQATGQCWCEAINYHPLWRLITYCGASVARWSIGNFWRFGVKISVETKKNREIRIFNSVFCQLYFNYLHTILNSSKIIRWFTSINLSLNLYCLLIYNMLSNVPRASS